METCRMFEGSFRSGCWKNMCGSATAFCLSIPICFDWEASIRIWARLAVFIAC